MGLPSWVAPVRCVRALGASVQPRDRGAGGRRGRGSSRSAVVGWGRGVPEFRGGGGGRPVPRPAGPGPLSSWGGAETFRTRGA